MAGPLIAFLLLRVWRYSRHGDSTSARRRLNGPVPVVVSDAVCRAHRSGVAIWRFGAAARDDRICLAADGQWLGTRSAVELARAERRTHLAPATRDEPAIGRLASGAFRGAPGSLVPKAAASRRGLACPRPRRGSLLAEQLRRAWMAINNRPRMWCAFTHRVSKRRAKIGTNCRILGKQRGLGRGCAVVARIFCQILVRIGPRTPTITLRWRRRI